MDPTSRPPGAKPERRRLTDEELEALRTLLSGRRPGPSVGAIAALVAAIATLISAITSGVVAIVNAVK